MEELEHGVDEPVERAVGRLVLHDLAMTETLAKL